MEERTANDGRVVLHGRKTSDHVRPPSLREPSISPKTSVCNGFREIPDRSCVLPGVSQAAWLKQIACHAFAVREKPAHPRYSSASHRIGTPRCTVQVPDVAIAHGFVTLPARFARLSQKCKRPCGLPRTALAARLVAGDTIRRYFMSAIASKVLPLTLNNA